MRSKLVVKDSGITKERVTKRRVWWFSNIACPLNSRTYKAALIDIVVALVIVKSNCNFHVQSLNGSGQNCHFETRKYQFCIWRQFCELFHTFSRIYII